jgi:DNA-binding transcriptional regulator PaaX
MGWIEHVQLVDLLADGLDTVTRASLRKLAGGFARCASGTRADQLVTRLVQHGWIERQGRGARATFRITAQARQRRTASDPRVSWGRPWDGAWRVVTFDLPEARRKDRQNLWRALRERKLGFLQRSVWIWPHDLTEILEQIIEVEGVPECFCGFETRRLFLCTDAEVVASSWDFRGIALRQLSYLKSAVTGSMAVQAANDFAKLASLARLEWQAYQYALSCDPLLPRILHPPGYRGEAVHQRHVAFRRQFRERLAALAG